MQRKTSTHLLSQWEGLQARGPGGRSGYTLSQESESRQDEGLGRAASMPGLIDLLLLVIFYFLKVPQPSRQLQQLEIKPSDTESRRGHCMLKS